MGCAAQKNGRIASVRERQVGIAVHGSGVSRVPAQLGFTRRSWCRPPLGPQPEYAGQDGDHGETPPLAAGSFESRIGQADAAAKGKQGLLRMPDGTRERCQGCLSKLMTRK